MGFIYKIQFPNGKNYIGLTTTSLEQRRQEHKYCAKRGETQCLYNALRKYDMVDTFKLIEIDTAETLEELCEMEIRCIDEYNSYYMNGKGYNMTFGGEGGNGYIFTEEDKQKHSEGRKKYYEQHPEARQQASETTKKQFETPGAKEKMSEIKKKYYETHPEAGKEHGEKMKKYYEEHPEARQQASETTKKQFETLEARQQHSETTKKQFETLEARQQHSEIRKKFFEDNPNAGKEHGERMKKYYQENPNAIKENSERKKIYYQKNPNAGKEQSERSKKYYQENPTAGKEQSERMKKYFENPLTRQNILDIKGKNKPFDIFSSDGTFIKTFNYQFEAKEYLQKEHYITSTIKISEVLSGTRHSSAGFVFKYK
jgi:hypothetical protein